jgi:8-oxo-dGTP diphosphatase
MQESLPEKIFEMKQVTESSTGEKFELTYKEDDPRKNLENRVIREVRAICFLDGKFVMVHEPEYKRWNLPGGKVEKGEDFEDAMIREVQEETNMEVLDHQFVGYIDTNSDEDPIQRFTYSICSVRPIGEFVADPDNDISEIKLIDPNDIKEYYNWGPISQRILARSLELIRTK